MKKKHKKIASKYLPSARYKETLQFNYSWVLVACVVLGEEITECRRANLKNINLILEINLNRE